VVACVDARHRSAHGRSRGDDSAPWEFGAFGAVPLATPLDLGTWAEDHTMDDLVL